MADYSAGYGLHCPHCNSTLLKVVQTVNLNTSSPKARKNPYDGVLRRKRLCRTCKDTFFTVEVIEELVLVLPKLNKGE